MSKILIVGDKSDNLYLLQSMLDTNGFKTISTQNGAEALELMKSDLPDLIISDILMPVMDGFTLCRECKKNDIFKNIPFIFYTATYFDEKDKEFAMNLGADLFILKPQKPDDFNKIISDLLIEVKKNNYKAKKGTQKKDSVILKEYNEVLIRKLEEKMAQTAVEEEDIRKSETKYRNLFDNNPQPMWIYDVETFAFLEVNDAAVHHYGYTREEFLSMTLKDIRPEEDVDALLKLVENSIKTYNSSGEWRHLKKNGEIIQVEIVSHSHTFNNREARHVMVNDITKRKLAEQELIKAKEHAEESDRLKTAFLCNMSHEIRTPMNGILGFAELLKEPGLNGDEQQEYIRIIEKSGARMLNIINDIMDISKIESGQMKISLAESDVNEQMEFIYKFFKAEVEPKGIELSIKTSLPSSEATISTDSEKLYAILTNLVKNAIKYTPKGYIEIGYNLLDKQGSAFLRFYVKDTGIGIPKHRQEAIFERFIQADIVDKMARQGAGLGLAISKAYVEMLGGKICVESEEGKGSTFYFTLPYLVKQKDESLPQKVVLADSGAYHVKNLKVLVVEDDEVSRLLISMAVKIFAKEIIEVESGTEAVEMCRRNPDIDLVLMDIQLPGMDGYEATHLIREFNTKVVIISQTAYALEGDREKSLAARCNGYIAKPIKRVELLELIQKYFPDGTGN